uniref:Si:ch211-194m7.5 n=1 Tax=Myripristis murdjan TaxID=586833 RepID=A0A667Z8P4_9TELE
MLKFPADATCHIYFPIQTGKEREALNFLQKWVRALVIILLFAWVSCVCLQTVELESLLLGLERRLPQLEADVTISRNMKFIYFADIILTCKISFFKSKGSIPSILLSAPLKSQNKTVIFLSCVLFAMLQLQTLRQEMQRLEVYDSMEVIKREKANQRLIKDLELCERSNQPTVQPTEPPPGFCPHGRLLNVTGPRVQTAGEYPGSYKFGSWGQDPKPEAGKESWYWMVALWSGIRHVHDHGRYQSCGGYASYYFLLLLSGSVQIHSSNPTTNTIQGPNAVLYAEALYYGCYNRDAICRFNLTTKSSNFCHLDDCYGYTDLDVATDESGIWVIYTTNEHYGNLVISRLEDGQQPELGQTWNTSLYKREIFYSFDTSTGKERFDVGIRIQKISANIVSLNYSPQDQMLHAYSDSQMVSYKVLFG